MDNSKSSIKAKLSAILDHPSKHKRKHFGAFLLIVSRFFVVLALLYVNISNSHHEKIPKAMMSASGIQVQ